MHLQVPVIGLILRSKKDSEGKPDLEIPYNEGEASSHSAPFLTLQLPCAKATSCPPTPHTGPRACPFPRVHLISRPLGWA